MRIKIFHTTTYIFNAKLIIVVSVGNGLVPKEVDI